MPLDTSATNTDATPVIRAIFLDATHEELVQIEERIGEFLLRVYLVYEKEIEEACMEESLDN